jgi:site-specific recombinase XerD
VTAPEFLGEPELVAEFTSSEPDSSIAKRRRQARAFFARFGDPADWQRASLADQLAAEPECGRFVGWLIVTGLVRPSPDYLLGRRGNLASIGDRVHAALSIEFADMSMELGYPVVLARRQWSTLLDIAALTATAANRVSDAQIDDAVQQLRAAADRAGNRSMRNLTANVFGMQAVLFHLGLIDRLPTRSNGRAGRRDAQWRHITEHAPLLAITLRDYLDQMGVRLRPNSIASVEKSLRIFAGYLIEHHPDIRCVADVRRNHVQAYKTWLATRTGNRGPSLANQTIRTRLGTLAAFFARLDELDIADRPPRVPVLRSDLPIKDDPLPRFIDDAASAKLLTAVRAHPDPFTRTAIELLARTGMRQSELLALTTDAVVQIGSSYWLRVPLGKLHTDRYIPLHPHLKTLLDDWITQRGDNARSKLLFLERGRRIRPSRLATALHSVAAEAGIGHVTPHQLRHTLATQAINRGMSLEAIAALLGHKSMSMTLVYARIADRTVADEYFAVTEKVEALYDQDRQLPADAEGSEMAKLRREAHRRMLGNGYCARPVELDCHFESICESCAFFVTTIEFRPTLQRQRDDAAAKGQVGRKKIFDGLLGRLDGDAAS